PFDPFARRSDGDGETVAMPPLRHLRAERGVLRHRGMRKLLLVLPVAALALGLLAPDAREARLVPSVAMHGASPVAPRAPRDSSTVVGAEIAWRSVASPPQHAPPERAPLAGEPLAVAATL